MKSRLSRLPRTDEVWEADIQPISVWGWNARHHGELWLGMVMERIENFLLALLASEAAPGINDLATLLASAMERPYVKGKRRPARIVLRNNPQWEELIPHLKQLKIEVITQQELPRWDDAAAAYVQKNEGKPLGSRSPDDHGSTGNRQSISGSCPLGQDLGTDRDRCQGAAGIRGSCRGSWKRERDRSRWLRTCESPLGYTRIEGRSDGASASVLPRLGDRLRTARPSACPTSCLPLAGPSSLARDPHVALGRRLRCRCGFCFWAFWLLL